MGESFTRTAIPPVALPRLDRSCQSLPRPDPPLGFD